MLLAPTGRRLLAVLLLGGSVLAPPAAGAPAGASADEALKAGREALERNALREALTQFRAAVERTPDSLLAQTYRGQVAEMLGELAEAYDAFQAAARLQPSDEATIRFASMAERMGNRAQALAELNRRLPVASGEAVAEATFRTLIESGDRPAALTLARERGWLRDGADYCGLPVSGIGRDTLALLAMLQHPGRADCAIRLGVSLTDGGLVGLARLVLAEVARHATSDGTRNQIRTFVRIRLPAHDVAPQAEALNIIGYRLANRHHKPDEAIAVYQRAIAVDPRFSWPYGNLGVQYAADGRFEEALQWLRRAVAANPDHWRAHVNLGSTAARLRRWEEALAAYTAAVRLNPSSAPEFAEIGRLLVLLGHRDEGVKALQHALRLDPQLRAAREFLNGVADRNRMVDEALDLMGVRTAAPRMAQAYREVLGTLMGQSAGDQSPIGQAIEETVTADRMYRLLAASVLSDFDHDRLARVLTWLRTPVARRMLQLEEAGASATPDVVREHAARLGGTDAERQARERSMGRLDAAQEATETELDVLTGLARGMARVTNNVLPADKQVTKDDLDRERRAARARVEPQTVLRFVYVYRDATAAELAEYLRFLESDLGRWFTAVIRRAIATTSEILAEQAARDAFERIATQTPRERT